MFFIILGIILWVFAPIFLQKLPAVINATRFKNPIRGLSILFIVIGFLTSCVKQVGAGHVAVQSLFGKIQNKILYSGLNIVNPLVHLLIVDTRTQNYTMSAVHDEGDKEGDDAIRVLTKDGLEITLDLSVLYRVNAQDAPQLLREVGDDYRDKIVRPLTRTKVRDFAVYYDAVQLYSTKRDEFQGNVFKSIESEFKKRGLFLENILVRNIELPTAVKKSIEEKISAEQDAQKMQFVLQKESQEAERKRLEARGIADYQKIINEGLTDKQLQYEQIKAYNQIANSKNSKIIIMPSKSPVIIDGK